MTEVMAVMLIVVPFGVFLCSVGRFLAHFVSGVSETKPDRTAAN